MGSTSYSNNVIYLRVTSIKDLKKIIDHFDTYPLITYKYKDFLLFKKAYSLILEKSHLTTEGIEKLVSIKASMNNNTLSESLTSAFPNVIPIKLPEMKKRPIADLHWVAGFTDAEGCFFVAHKKSPQSKLGEAVWLKFIITQDLRDEDLLKNFINLFGCGRFIIKKSDNCGEFVVEKYSDIREKIIPFFDRYCLVGIKLLNFMDFKKVSVLMDNKAHLTERGLNEIKAIKSGMNKSRIF